MKIQKGKAAKLLAVVLSLCITIAFLPIVAFATGDTASISVTFRQGSENNGNIEFYDGVNWRIISGPEVQNVEAVRIRPNQGYSVDWTGIALRVNGENILTDDIRNQLVSDNGFTLTAGTAYALEEVEFRQGGGGPTPSETHSIDFGSGSWTVGEQTVTANKSGIVSELSMDEEIVLNGFDADKMQVKLVAEDGFSTTLTVTDGKTSLSAKNCEGLPAGTLTFSVEEKGGPEPGPGPEPGEDPAHEGYEEGEPKTASVTVTGKADFYINDSNMVNANDGDRFDDIGYRYNRNGTVDFYFCCFIVERITTLKINGVDYYGELPTPDTEEGKAALLDACKGQINEFKITVPYSESGYAIESNVKWLDDEDKDYMVVGNFLWTYEDENQGDDYIDHGRMELIGVNYKGRDYSPEELTNPGTGLNWGQDEHGGSAVLPVGSVVTVKLLPDYGYQLTSFGINGNDFGTGDEQSVFTFEIKPGNAHLGAHFTSVSDKVKTSSNIVESGSITLGSGLSGGSARLEISDAENDLSEEKREAFESAAGNYNITDYLNLDLYNVYYKGTTDEENVWKNEINTLDNDATISVDLDVLSDGSAVEASDIVIIHNIHNGEKFETISVDSFDSETNTITFKTDSFSTYAIATTRSQGFDTVDESVDNSSVNVTCKIVVKDKTIGKTESKEVRTIKPTGGVTVGTVSAVCDETVEKAKTVLSEYVELMKKDNPKLQITVTGNPEVSGDTTPFDNRTYTMKLNANNQRYLHIEGDYGKKAIYVVSLTVETEEVKLPVYNFLEGADNSWTQSSNGTLTFRINGDFSKFTGVKVDGTLIDAKNYTAVSGSTVITLKADYLKTFSAGTHKLTVVYTDGECSTNFEVKQAASKQTKPNEVDASDTTTPTGGKDTTSPQTGDNINLLLWVALLFVSVFGLAGTAVYSKRKREK